MCNCYELLSARLYNAGQTFVGIVRGPELGAPSALAFLTAGIVLQRKGARKRGLIYANFCPWCGKAIRESSMKKGEDVNGSHPSKSPA